MESVNELKGLRAKRNLSQDQVASMLKISRQTYNNLENDLLNSDFTLVFKLLNKLNITENETNEFFNALKQDYLSYEERKKE